MLFISIITSQKNKNNFVKKKNVIKKNNIKVEVIIKPVENLNGG